MEINEWHKPFVEKSTRNLYLYIFIYVLISYGISFLISPFILIYILILPSFFILVMINIKSQPSNFRMKENSIEIQESVLFNDISIYSIESIKEAEFIKTSSYDSQKMKNIDDYLININIYVSDEKSYVYYSFRIVEKEYQNILVLFKSRNIKTIEP
ncbi:hypothetical protein KMW28_24380 [Flammeovirga yaeyamensis]|uniref:Uncharacterized protein n=1 Tax=Flammeovirga yaeyamensis TaxID=367791 RepID=A0AAX1N9A9_9BACT|nr:hypothetical protein [Flammeovirga yaeyamensis]MBB3699577.1 ABC-type multidrug transport system fused ATPase/permease subunit [Flammeovirga yaeyamensis]NMF35168.1 hypothetical protein [Flammeovirga yaeyamensis]QWG04032.1 hypothetical protein KMW28_24380 [Flammeovirga yaeyamensis]